MRDECERAALVKYRPVPFCMAFPCFFPEFGDRVFRRSDYVLAKAKYISRSD